ncbi:DUF1796 family putative cysteine peptidase [Telmatospirillum siberiense]|uniref:Uncharacterized protein n=1 Tax=Telmatospirillum siberiense TaxID=382514 RepID=A0A2N3PR36_9PROT|nr:DUF1796 family putative cysteine peptidase [Telmatospirillum siberiense]PKU22865.1 hypothetical protein CWS72_19620 [Telmatospirillum siberiense]
MDYDQGTPFGRGEIGIDLADIDRLSGFFGQCQESFPEDIDDKIEKNFEVKSFDESVTSFFMTQCFVPGTRNFLSALSQLSIAIWAGEVQFHHEFFVEVMTRRLYNYANLLSDKINVISIGDNCISRTLPTRWGYKRPAILGEKTMPFDLSTHTLETIVEQISSHFSDYMNPENLEYVQEADFCVDVKNDIQWSHDRGRHLAENNFQGLRDLYAKRIDLFYRVIGNGKPIIFILHHIRRVNGAFGAWNGETADLLGQLLKGLKPVCGNRFIILVLGGNETPPSEDFFNFDKGSIQYVHLPYPFPDDQNWWMPRYYMTKPGLEFERTFMAGLQQCVDQLLGGSRSAVGFSDVAAGFCP